MNLTKELKEKAEGFNKQAPKNIVMEMQKAYEELVAKKIGVNSITEGDKFPEFELFNQNKEKVGLSDLLVNKKFLVISFYRGGWCPYCNLELRALQSKLKDFEELGAGLVAITSEMPGQSLSTAEKNELEFEVLSDLNSLLAEKVGLSFELPENLKPIYIDFGINIPEHNGENNFTLPIPATFIINCKREVIYSFKDLDYKVRLDPDEILEKLK